VANNSKKTRKLQDKGSLISVTPKAHKLLTESAYANNLPIKYLASQIIVAELEKKVSSV